MVGCEVGGTMAGGIPESLVMGDGGGSEVTAEVKADFPCCTAGDRGVCGHRTCLQVCDSISIPHSALTDHYYRLPPFASV